MSRDPTPATVLLDQIEAKAIPENFTDYSRGPSLGETCPELISGRELITHGTRTRLSSNSGKPRQSFQESPSDATWSCQGQICCNRLANESRRCPSPGLEPHDCLQAPCTSSLAPHCGWQKTWLTGRDPFSSKRSSKLFKLFTPLEQLPTTQPIATSLQLYSNNTSDKTVLRAQSSRYRIAKWP